ncbi:MAG: alpha/beta fold hydrolase [Candidatus Rokuibacteriota bacterium]
MPRAPIGDAEIYYEESGQGEPLLLVPGLSGVGSFWVPQVADFKRDFRVVIHDHRGTGQSTHSRITYSVEQMAADVLKLMDALGIDAAHFVGHSTGGAIGQVLAIEHPRRLKSLVLSATWAGPDPYFRRVFESRKDVLQGLGLEAYLKASALMLMPPAWISANDRVLSEQHRATLAASSAPIEVMTSRIDAIVRHDQRARLGEIRLPALVIVAQDDMITPRFYSDELASRVPGAKLVVLDGGGHFAPIAAADSYNRAVGAFLRGLLGR